MSEVLRLTNVHKWVIAEESRTDILRGVSMTLKQGEFVAIMGASGSGKSTLLNLIGLLDRPSAGELHLLGRDAAHFSDDKLAEARARTIGFIFQSFNLLPYLTAMENVTLPMLYTRAQHRDQRAQSLLESMRLEHRLKAYPATLSGGEKQRVAIARALANQPSLILADEPTGALDSTTGKQIMDLLSDLHHKGTTIVVVTHDEAIAARAERTLHMRDGQFV